jgi:hypothetical protein
MIRSPVPKGTGLFCAHKMTAMKFLLIILALSALLRRLIPEGGADH